jgi:prophage antirepressor-like protein
MSALEVFRYEDAEVRSTIVDDEPVFVAKDVCAVLGIVKYRDAIANLEPEERVSVAVDTPGGLQRMSAVTEAGVYALMLVSRSPLVKPFRRWLLHEVLPQIRQTGSYQPEQAWEVPSSFAEALELAAAQARELEATKAELVEAAPKVEAFDTFMDADGVLSLEVAAKALGMGRQRFITRLQELRILQHAPGRPQHNVPYQSHAHHFEVLIGSRPSSSGPVATYTTRVKPSGMEYLRRKLASDLAVVT